MPLPQLAIKLDGLVQLVSAQPAEGETGQVADQNAGQPEQAHGLLCCHGRALVLQLVVCTHSKQQSATAFMRPFPKGSPHFRSKFWLQTTYCETQGPSSRTFALRHSAVISS